MECTRRLPVLPLQAAAQILLPIMEAAPRALTKTAAGIHHAVNALLPVNVAGVDLLVLVFLMDVSLALHALFHLNRQQLHAPIPHHLHKRHQLLHRHLVLRQRRQSMERNNRCVCLIRTKRKLLLQA